jgi:hypothetical protein
VGRTTRESASELRAVAPLVVVAGDKLELVGPCTLVTNGAKTVAFSGAELLRVAAEPLAIALTLDGKRTVPVKSWSYARFTTLGLIELGEPFPKDGPLDVQPLDVGKVCAAVDTRGAPAGIVVVTYAGGVFSRRVVPVFVDAWDGAGMRDDVIHLATPQEAGDAGQRIDGAPLFAWMPSDPVLGRGPETVAVALAVPCSSRAQKVRELVPNAELVALDDLGRVLPYDAEAQEGSNDLNQVAGEIKDDASGPLAGLDLDD